MSSVEEERSVEHEDGASEPDSKRRKVKAEEEGAEGGSVVKTEGEKSDGGGGGGTHGEGVGLVSELSAAQVINMAVEMLGDVQTSGGQSGAAGMLKMCFNDAIVVTSLESNATLIQGRDRLISVLVASASAAGAAPMAEMAARVVFDGKGSAAPAPPSFSLDLYGAATSPLACLKGGGSAVLCRARACQLDQIWVGNINAVSKEKLLESAGWQQTLAVVTASVTMQTEFEVTYNNYADSHDPSGLGLGSVSKSESWDVTLGQAPITEDEILKMNEAFEKVSKHLCNDAKFGKASKLLLQMLSSHLLAPTGPAALGAIRCALGEGDRAAAERTQEVVAAIVNVAWEKRATLCGEGSVDRRVLECWHTLCTLPRRLATDDSFSFAKAAKEVQVALEKWTAGGSEGVKEEGEADVNKWKAQALFVSLQQLVRMYQHQWARTPVDMCFKVLMDPKKRALFGKKLSAVEDLINILQKKKKGNEKHQHDSQGHYQGSGFQHGKMGW